jgi:MtN3 and saliva related transmembrane protein
LHVSTLDLLGYAAALLTTASLVPQAVRLWRTRSTRDISLTTYLMFSVGVALWFAYGLLTGAWPLTVANGVGLGLALTILGFKLRYG